MQNLASLHGTKFWLIGGSHRTLWGGCILLIHKVGKMNFVELQGNMFAWKGFSPKIIDKVLKSSEDFVWPVELPFHGKFIIEVDFMDLKVAGPNVGQIPLSKSRASVLSFLYGMAKSDMNSLERTIIVCVVVVLLEHFRFHLKDGEPCSIWSTQGTVHSQAQQCALNSLTCMLSNGLHADVTINTAKGRIGAHRAILAARSPVFKKMFGHGSNEEESSTIDMEEMSIEACRALLGYIYGCIHYDEFQKHRLALLRAADKYDIVDLKEACEERFLDDIDLKNVLERLQDSWSYHLPRLRQGCLKYLLSFGKVFDVREDLNVFLQHADRDLIVEIFQEVLNVWKDY
eukprot:Gb_11912 [translate_table: standard]